MYSLTCVADFTFERFVTKVGLVMSIKASQLLEGLVTHITLVCFISRFHCKKTNYLVHVFNLLFICTCISYNTLMTGNTYY